jgi:adenine-specific DNA methylase
MTISCKKLIEVAMPIKEISAESVRDKSIRHGHISTLHLWWARRPLPVWKTVMKCNNFKIEYLIMNTKSI